MRLATGSILRFPSATSNARPKMAASECVEEEAKPCQAAVAPAYASRTLSAQYRCGRPRLRKAADRRAADSRRMRQWKLPQLVARRGRYCSQRCLGFSFQVSKFTEELQAGVNLAAGQGLQALGAEAFDGDVSHEASGEGISGAGSVLYFFERKSGSAKRMAADAECSFGKENRGAVFAMFYDQRLWSHGDHLPCRPRQAGVLGQHFYLGVVDEQNVHQTKSFTKLLISALDPEVHGVAAGQLYF